MSGRALILAGQGAQAVGMGRDLVAAIPACAAIFARADEVLGYPLSKICFEGPDEELTRSDRCQPGIFVASVACHAALAARCPGLSFVGAAGLSLGEWTALHLAGALSFEDALRALEARGRFMQEACAASAGGMVSLMGLAPPKVADVAAAAGVEIANVNSPEQIVLSGPREAIATADRLAREAGAKKTVILNVAGAFHSRLMQPAAERLRAVLEGIVFQTPRIPVVSNVTGRPHGDPAQMRVDLVRQVTQPVQWVACVEWLAGQGATGFVECGPGRVLSGLIKRIAAGAALANVQDVASLDKTAALLAHGRDVTRR